MHDLVDIYHNIHITGPTGLGLAILGGLAGLVTSETKDDRLPRTILGAVIGSVIAVFVVAGAVLN